MTNVCLAGSTGLVGSEILSTLAREPAISLIHAFTRRDLPANPKVLAIRDADSEAWPNFFPSDTTLFFTALGTTAHIAGGFENQKKIDYDLNLALAKAAKRSHVKVLVLISSSGADVTSRFPYLRMKGKLDEDVTAIGFERTIILKPGLLVGARQDSRPGEFGARMVASFLGKISGNLLKDAWAQDADVVARAAVVAGLEAAHDNNVEPVRILNQKDIIRLGTMK